MAVSKLNNVIPCSITEQSTPSYVLREVLFVARAGSDIIKPVSAQNKRTTVSTKTRIGIKLENLEKCPEIISLQCFPI